MEICAWQKATREPNPVGEAQASIIDSFFVINVSNILQKD
jgi:hypothetical protein